jgi:hypothetical protein
MKSVRPYALNSSISSSMKKKYLSLNFQDTFPNLIIWDPSDDFKVMMISKSKALYSVTSGFIIISQTIINARELLCGPL